MANIDTFDPRSCFSRKIIDDMFVFVPSECPDLLPAPLMTRNHGHYDPRSRRYRGRLGGRDSPEAFDVQVDPGGKPGPASGGDRDDPAAFLAADPVAAQEFIGERSP